MSEPDWRHRPDGDSASLASLHAHATHSDMLVEVATMAQPHADTSPAGVALTEVWEYLGKH